MLLYWVCESINGLIYEQRENMGFTGSMEELEHDAQLKLEKNLNRDEAG